MLEGPYVVRLHFHVTSNLKELSLVQFQALKTKESAEISLQSSILIIKFIK